MTRRVRLCSKASLFYIICSCLCASYPVLASINGWVQGSTLPDTTLKFCEHYELYEGFLSTSYGLTHSDGVLGMQLQYHLGNQIVLPKLRHKQSGQPKFFPASSLVQSFVLIVCTAENILYAFVIFLVGIGALITVYPYLVVSCVALVLGACIVNSVNSLKPQRNVTVVSPNVFHSIGTDIKSHTNTDFFLSKVTYLYSPRSLISTLLLMSGDIESNPGPVPSSNSSDNSSPKTHTSSDIETNPKLPPSSLESPKEDPQLLHGHITFTPATDDIHKSDDVGRKLDVPRLEKPAISDSPEKTPTRFTSESAFEFDTQLSEVTEDEFQLQTPSDTATFKSQMVAQNLSKPKLPSSNETAGLHASVEKQNESGRFPSNELVLPQSAHREDDFVSKDFRQRFRRKSFTDSKTFGIEIRREVTHFVSRLEKDGKWQSETGLTVHDQQEDAYVKLISIANPLYRIGEGCNICPICTKRKANHDKPDSHVIPKGILKVYTRIHCDNETKFLFDFSRQKSLCAKDFSFPLLCNDCEKRCVEIENRLRTVYICAMTKPDFCFQFTHENGWFYCVLANIVFRGLLVNAELTLDLHARKDLDFRRKFLSLWKYCKSKDNEVTAPNLYLFLLPNKPFNEDMFYFMYGIETVIRSPMLTQCVTKERVGTFLLTKFDGFHVVLPIDRGSEDYFGKFKNNRITPSLEKIKLQPCKRDNVVVKKPRHSKAVHVSYPDQALPHLFPEVLLRYNIELYGEFFLMCYATTKTYLNERKIKCLLIQYPGLDYEYPHDPALEDRPPFEPTDHRLEYEINIESLTKSQEGIDDMIKHASDISPMMRVKKQMKELEEKKQKVITLEKELEEQKKQVKTHKASLNRAISEETRLTKLLSKKTYQYRMLDHEHAALRYEHELEKKYQLMHTLLFRQMRYLVRKVRETQATTMPQGRCCVHDTLIDEYLAIVHETQKEDFVHNEKTLALLQRFVKLEQVIRNELQRIKQPEHIKRMSRSLDPADIARFRKRYSSVGSEPILPEEFDQTECTFNLPEMN